MTSTSSDKKYIMDDPIIENQKYVLFSFASKKNIKDANIDAFKFRGAFATFDEANAYAKKLQDMDPDFNIFMGEGFKWIPFDPDLDKIENHEYYEKELNQIMKANKEQLMEQKKIEAQRKAEMKKANKTSDEVKDESIKKIDENIETVNSNLDRLKAAFDKLNSV